MHNSVKNKLTNRKNQHNHGLPCLQGTPDLLDLLKGHAHPKQHIVCRHIYGLELDTEKD